MRDLHMRYPVYGFARHKGYSTPSHMRALNAHGPCPEHRRSFANVGGVARDPAGLGTGDPVDLETGNLVDLETGGLVDPETGGLVDLGASGPASPGAGDRTDLEN
jgi:hypothetical protein